MQMKPGALIVFEGLDKTGKTTQRDLLVERNWDEPAPAVFHMPSGQGGEWPADVYAMLEASRVRDPLARQLLHLACHAEVIPEIQRALGSRAVILDRWWWSTLAYGLDGDGLGERIGAGAFEQSVRMVWDRVSADLVFLFLQPHEDDVANRAGVGGGYRQIAARDPSAVVEVSAADPDGTHAQIIDALAARGLLNE